MRKPIGRRGAEIGPAAQKERGRDGRETVTTIKEAMWISHVPSCSFRPLFLSFFPRLNFHPIAFEIWPKWTYFLVREKPNRVKTCLLTGFLQGRRGGGAAACFFSRRNSSLFGSSVSDAASTYCTGWSYQGRALPS